MKKNMEEDSVIYWLKKIYRALDIIGVMLLILLLTKI